MAKNKRKSSWNHPRKHLGSITEAARLEFSSRKHVFSPKTIEMHSIWVRGALKKTPLPLFVGGKGEEVAAQLAQASRWLP